MTIPLIGPVQFGFAKGRETELRHVDGELLEPVLKEAA